MNRGTQVPAAGDDRLLHGCRVHLAARSGVMGVSNRPVSRRATRRGADAAAGVRHDLADADGVRSVGAVRVSTVTPAAITAKATAATVIFAGLSVKRSPNSQTLKMMLAK